MFKNHPKGLLAASLSNMGERFGFYIMMAILLLFLNFKFDFSGSTGSIIYSVFYAAIYLLALAGGVIADKTKKYKKTILIGLVLMTAGYVILAIPTKTPVENMSLILTVTCIGLFAIAFGNGLFKGNLQAVVGQLYDDPKYADKRETGFQIFYMFINIGAMFAPLMAVGLRNWWVQSNGYQFNADLPKLCNQYLSGTITPEASARFTELAKEVGNTSPDLATFANNYLDVFVTGYHYSFGIAIVAMVISLVIYIINQKGLPDPAAKKLDGAQAANVVEMSKDEVKQRLYALFAVYAVVIFFWFSFHQNGQTLTLFANDYTKLVKLDLGFTTLQGAEIFQTFNPFFVVFLTPVVIGFFGWMKARGIEMSTPKKIAVGMGIAAVAFAVMAFGSFGLPSDAERLAMGGLDETQRVTPFLLIGTYLILTVAELFISPLGIAFVSKVAPPQYQGIMQGCWLGATALGNQILFIGVILYQSIPVWATWCVFVVACCISMFTMLFMLKWLERITK
ncbi:POT family proton-dependent oligopeptide transporter [Dysgonomonas sp. PH5-45]|uniref:peptide MFS transporter n=1 Tax=unclassified Dysgonomonas TaxID=2630389 RepID=UPI002476C214|nr:MULTISPECIES: peptide MFS transporter [unclassified Dysgonomonas]MDH6353969.1 POT family proton-dependent oligopeptide transporter [Dysgonomonas sp. PH5-45]MDH6386871.1 POT family proton-dependent oligopeptide transporter [Dysgonomonas sp. PH5-37]